MSDTLNALVEAADDYVRDCGILGGTGMRAATAVAKAAVQGTPSLRASLARDAALEQYIGELREGPITQEDCRHCIADRLTQILEGRK